MNDYLADKRLPYLPGDQYNVHPYIIQKLLPGDKHTSVYCDRCGNLANALTVGFEGLKEFWVPLCRTHAQELLDNDPEAYIAEHKCIITGAIQEQLPRHRELLHQNLVR